MKETEISKFINYSRIYSSIIDLDVFYDDSKNLYDEIKDIIKDKVFNIYQDEDDFNLEDLIDLNNKIHIINENSNNNLADNSEEKQLKCEKYDILICLKIWCGI